MYIGTFELLKPQKTLYCHTVELIRRITKMVTNKIETEEHKNQELKHLGFMRIAVINILIWISSLYEYAKQNSGPLRSGVGTVEGTVTTVIRPVLNKFKDVPQNLLVFFDNKVDEAAQMYDEHAPPLAKQITTNIWLLIKKTSQLIQTIVSETRTKGVPVAANDAMSKSEKYLLEKAAYAWFRLDQLTIFHYIVVGLVVPTTARWMEKYNQFVVSMTKEGSIVFSYLPLVPVDKITKAFKRVSTGVKED